MIFYISKLIRSDNKINPIYVIRNLKIKISGIIIVSIFFPLFIEIIQLILVRNNTYPEMLESRLQTFGYLNIYNFYFSNCKIDNSILGELFGVFSFFASQVGLIYTLIFLFYFFKINKSRNLIPLILLRFWKVSFYSPFFFLPISTYFRLIGNPQNTKSDFL